jgi:MerR family transcriptional regulator, light-induced transcriptional regulator
MADSTGQSPVVDAVAFARAKGVFSRPVHRLPAEAVQALAGEVISRLSHRHSISRPPLSLAPEVPIGPEMESRIQRLAEALLDVEDAPATEIVAEVHAAGQDAETIYLGLLAEAARLLGRWWEDDRVSALEVVLAAGRIYALMRGLRRVFGATSLRGGPFRALFATTPGETHSIGVTMAADLLARHGWEIDLRAGLAHDELVAEVQGLGHDIIGLSASAPRMLFPLARLIVALRMSHPSAWIIVSGRIAEYEPEVAHLVDADAAAADLTRAEELMEAHVADLCARAKA